MITAKLNYLRIAPRKVRLVTDQIRGKSAEEAQAILNFTVKRATKSLMKLLNQALASAHNNLQLDPSNLYISKITVDEGPKYKRWMPRARGRVSEIQKKSSHITLVLDTISGKSPKGPRRIGTYGAGKKIKKAKEVSPVRPEKIKKVLKVKKAKPRPEREIAKPKIERGVKRIFKRKAF
jgi:large subunit ribosomal protein L22